MLNFIGTGSAFNTRLGNNGAFIKNDNHLFLIDCGSTTFSRLKARGVLDGINKVDVLITHTHADHIGSLGDLILYGFYSMGEMKASVNIICPNDLVEDVYKLLELMGVRDYTYTITNLVKGLSYCTSTPVDENHINIYRYCRTAHVTELKCYSYELIYKGKKIFYSGDTRMFPYGSLELLHDGYYDYFYIDTCKSDYEGNVHLSLKKLNEEIKENRDRVYCMHLDEGFDVKEAEGMGFNVVKSVFDMEV